MLAFASGVAALAHETLWTRRLVDILGASAETFSKVIGAFFLGLALGAWLSASRKLRTRASWLYIAVAELSIGLLAIPILISPVWSESLFLQPSLIPWLKMVLPIILVTPPAAAMGLVLPLLIEASARQGKASVNLGVWLYGANTVGGIVGVSCITFAPLPAIGLNRVGLLVSGINFALAAAALLLHRLSGKRVSPADWEQNSGDTVTGKEWTFQILAFASGFLVLTVEVLLQHQLAQVTINSQFSGGTVLALVLFALAAAAIFLPAIMRCTNEARALRAILAATVALCAAQPFLFTWMRNGVTILPYELKALPYALELLRLGLVAACPMLLASGMIFPLLLRRASGKGIRWIGGLFALNGLGGWIGTEFAQNWLAPRFGLWVGMECVAAGYLVLWLNSLVHSNRSTGEPSPAHNQIARFSLVTGMILCLLLCTYSAQYLPQATVLPGERLVALRTGREGVVATVECAPGDWRILFNNSYTLGGSRAQFNQERQGLLPLLLHGAPKSVATLGVATGSTAAGAALYPGVERLDAIELSPLVLAYAGEYFPAFNRNIFRDPRARFIVEDARWVMARQRNTYDAIIGDLFLPWRTGEGRLFTLEHFQNVRQALKPGGIYCQWLPLFQLTRPQFDAIARTFRQVFPEAFLVRGDFYFDLPIIGLIGGRQIEAIDWTAVAQACERLRADGSVTDPLVRHADGVAMLLLGPLPEPTAGPINTLANSWLEWDAGQNVVGLKTPWFVGIPCAEYIRDIQRSGNPLIPAFLRAAQDSGQFFLTLEVATALNLPSKTGLEEQIPMRLPPSLIRDFQSDWKQWPARLKFSVSSNHEK